jgi:hypothetical protein
MGKKRKTRVPKTGPVWRLSSEEATLAKMPHYNAHACGTGPHGDTSYNRAKSKRAWKNDPDIKGACNRRLPLVMHQSARRDSDDHRDCHMQMERSSSIVSTMWVGLAASRSARGPMPQVTAIVLQPAAFPAWMSKMLSPT